MRPILMQSLSCPESMQFTLNPRMERVRRRDGFPARPLFRQGEHLLSFALRQRLE